MKKNPILRICLFLLAGITQLVCAQSIELPEIGRRGFKGIRPMSQQGYYIQFEEENQVDKKTSNRDVRLIILNNALKVEADIKLPLKSDERLEDLSYTDGKFLVITALPAKRTKTFQLIDPKGTSLATRQQTDLNVRIFDQPSTIIPIENDFIVVSMFRDKKVGYVLERFSSSLEPKFTETYTPEKKKLYPVDFVVANNLLYVLEYYARDLNDSFEYHIAGFNTSTGKQLFNHYLKSMDDKSYGYATFLRSTPKGEAVTGGMYFNGDKEQEANSDGFFTALVTPEGNLKYEYKPWSAVADKVKDKGTGLLLGGKTKTLIQDMVVNSDGSFTLIGENFRRGDEGQAGGKGGLMKAASIASGGSPDEEVAVTVSDFLLFDFDAKNTFINLRKINKPFSVTVIHPSPNPNDKPYVGQFRGLNLANMLNNYGYFPYRFTTTHKGEKVLVYQVNYDRQYKELLYFTKLNATTTDTVSVEITNSYLKADQQFNSNVTKKMGKLGALQQKLNKVSGEDIQNELTLGASDDPSNFRRGTSPSIRIFPANIDGKVVVYDFVPQLTGSDAQKKSMLSEYMSNANAAAKGTLKIWYIDIPASR